MPRRLYPDDTSTWVVSSGRFLPAQRGSVVQVYVDEDPYGEPAANTLADVVAEDGAALTDGLTVGPYTELPRWLGPDDESDTLIVRVNDGPPWRVRADLGRRMHALERYVPAGWGSVWRPALQAAAEGTGKARVHILGASVSRGFYATDLESTGWAALVRSGLQGLSGDGGSGFRGVFDTALFLNDSAKATYYGAISNNLWTLAGSGWGNINFVAGPTGRDAIITQHAGDTASIRVRGTTVTLYTLDAGDGTGTWTYRIDGGSPTTVSAPASFAARKTVISGLAPGNHTVLFTLTAGYLMICGAAGENSTGVVVNNISKSGADGAQWNGTDGPPVSADWAGGVNYPTDLLVWNLSENEVAGGGTSVATAVQNARLCFDRVRDNSTVNGLVDLAIVLDHAGTYDTGGHHWHDLAAQLRSLAATYGAAMFDMWSAGRNSWNYWHSRGFWGNPADPTTAGTDFVHLSNAGHAYVAARILDVIAH